MPLTFWGSEGDLVSGFTAVGRHDSFQASLSADLRFLQLRGFKGDTVNDVGDSLDDNLDGDRIDSCERLVHSCDEMYENGQTRLEAFWRTMIADQMNEDYPAPDEIGPLFSK